MNRTLRTALATVAFLVGAGAASAKPSCADAQALGTTRDIEVAGPMRLGLKTYPQTLDLHDHEVVLTFDDGPSRTTTPRILDALEKACVTADFFLIGRNAAAAPLLVRREIQDGDTVGHHSYSHPAVTLRGLSDAAARADIDKGIEADDTAAYGSYSGQPRVPFFRFPGFADTPALLDHLGSENIAVFGADLWASDWIPMTPDVELHVLMARLDRAGRGIILLHDTKEQTAMMLPRFLDALKAGGYHVVHVVPGTATTATRPAPAGWHSETARIIEHLWPKIAHASLATPAALRPSEP